MISILYEKKINFKFQFINLKENNFKFFNNLENNFIFDSENFVIGEGSSL